MSFAIARQPVFDSEGEIFGYEVYLRRTDNLESYPQDIPYNKATFIVAELIGELGVKRISEGKKIFVNVTLDSEEEQYSLRSSSTPQSIWIFWKGLPSWSSGLRALTRVSLQG